jgi:hypothetical protein
MGHFNEPLYDGALIAAPFVMMVGIVFMAGCKKIWKINFKKLDVLKDVDLGHRDAALWGAMLSHTMFIIGEEGNMN